jgi:transposase InsO family protein
MESQENGAGLTAVAVALMTACILLVMLDVWSRKVVGWATASHLRTELVLDRHCCVGLPDTKRHQWATASGVFESPTAEG